MRTYLIDAFNLLYRVDQLKKSNQPHFDLINYIRRNKLTGSSNNEVIVVFDGHPVENIDRGAYQVLFSFSTTADNVIARKLDSIKDKNQVIVVSDDRAIRDYAKKSGAVSQRIADFLKKSEHNQPSGYSKDISYSLQSEITQEMRKIWDKP